MKGGENGRGGTGIVEIALNFLFSPPTAAILLNVLTPPEPALHVHVVTQPTVVPLKEVR